MIIRIVDVPSVFRRKGCPLSGTDGMSAVLRMAQRKIAIRGR